jgi:hypothetical protein
MFDVLRLFRNIQKPSQRSLITISDSILVKNQVISSLELMTHAPYPGGMEENHLAKNS